MERAFWVARIAIECFGALFYYQAENQAALHVKLYLLLQLLASLVDFQSYFTLHRISSLCIDRIYL